MISGITLYTGLPRCKASSNEMQYTAGRAAPRTQWLIMRPGDCSRNPGVPTLRIQDTLFLKTSFLIPITKSVFSHINIIYVSTGHYSYLPFWTNTLIQFLCAVTKKGTIWTCSVEVMSRWKEYPVQRLQPENGFKGVSYVTAGNKVTEAG